MSKLQPQANANERDVTVALTDRASRLYLPHSADELHFPPRSFALSTTDSSSIMAASNGAPSNPLITTKAPDAPLSVQLHPLVLLTISDYVTRHVSRQQEGLIVGAIIGQQNGRNFTLEHAFEVKTVESTDDIKVDAEWFGERLEQYRDVHKDPALDLVGIFTLGSVDGPNTAHVQVVRHVQQVAGTDSVMLLLFHPEMVNDLQGGKLPITLFESFGDSAESGETETKFRELAYEVETGEAEMISVDYVASGAGNATAVQKAADATAGAESSKKGESKAKGKGRAKDGETNGADEAGVLSAEDEELIASLTAKANAIKMLNQRINLIRQYLTTLPTSYLTDANATEAPPPDQTNHALLRSINAMLSRLPLLNPPEPTSDTKGDASQALRDQQTGQDKQLESVHLTSLLSSLTRSLNEAQSLSSKFAVVQRERQAKNNLGAAKGPGKFVGFGEEGGLMSGEAGTGF